MSEVAPPAPTAAASSAQRRGSLRNILLNAGWLMGGKGVAAVLSAVYLALITRSLGVNGFGQFALAVGIAQAVNGFATFQSWQVVVRYGMPHLHAGDGPALARVIRFGARLDLLSAVLGGMVVVAGFLLLGPRFGWSPAFERDALLAMLPLVLAIHSAPTGVLRLHDRFAAATMAETVTPLCRFVGALAVWLTGPTPIRFMIVWSLSEVATCAAYWIAAWRNGPDPHAGGKAPWPILRAENPGIARYAAITNASASLDQGGKQGLVLLMGLLVGPAAAGGFRFAQQLAQSMAKISQTLARAIFPELMRSRAQGGDDAGGFDRLFRRTTRLAALGGAIVLVLLVTVGRPLLHLIAGPAFLPFYPMLVVLGAAAAVDFAGVGFEPALAAQGRAGTALAIRVGTVALMLALLFALTRDAGAIGGAVAVLIAALATFALMWRAVRG